MKKGMVKIGHMEVPTDYFTLPEDEKQVVCYSILESMLQLLEKNLKPETDTFDILNKIIESSIIMNEHDENYEIAGVLLDIKKIVNED